MTLHRLRATLSLAMARTAVVLLVSVLIGAMAQPIAAAVDDVSFVATIDDRDLRTGDNDSPIRLRPDDRVTIELDVENTSGAPLLLGYVRLQGSAIGIDFLTTDTTVRFPLAAGERRVFQIPIEFFDLEDQATGLVRGSVILFDEERNELGSVDFIADVEGSAFSGLGIFSFVVLLFSVTSLAFNLYLVARRRLHKSRIVRGVQFAFSGLAIGLLFALALSVLRITTTAPAASLLAIVVPTLVAFGIGYLTPNRLSSWYLWEQEMIEQGWIDLEDEVRATYEKPVDPRATVT